MHDLANENEFILTHLSPKLSSMSFYGRTYDYNFL